MMRRLLAVLGLTAALGLVAPSSVAAADSSRARVLQPSSHPYGATYGQWSARWWQWAFNTPLHGPAGEQSQFLTVGTTPTPVDCSYGQRGRVWFLAGTFPNAGSANRACTVSKGKALFFPVFNYWQDNLNFPGQPPFTLTKQELRAATRAQVDAVSTLSATVDGHTVPDVTGPQSHYRARSPFFSYMLPADSLISFGFGATFPPGTTPPPPGALSDGVYLLLAPLAEGTHVLHWTADAGALGQVDITYTITVGD